MPDLISYDEEGSTIKSNMNHLKARAIGKLCCDWKLIKHYLKERTLYFLRVVVVFMKVLVSIFSRAAGTYSFIKYINFINESANVLRLLKIS